MGGVTAVKEESGPGGSPVQLTLTSGVESLKSQGILEFNAAIEPRQELSF